MNIGNKSLDPLIQKEIKKALGKKASMLIEKGMLVGLGTGSTAVCFIESLIERTKKEGLKIQTVSSSTRSMELARAGGLSVLEMDAITSIDLTVDGADEIDPKNRMIKGGGGAHVREKILASTSRQLVITIDESKLVTTLGAFGLPVEILRFGCQATIMKLRKLGFDGTLRKKEDGSFYITDNGNYIFDIQSPTQFPHPEEDDERIRKIPGVLDTGFFFNLATKVLVGYADGKVEFRK